MSTTPARGTALLTVLIVLVVITALGAGVILLSGKHMAGAAARESAVGLSNCAQAVRQYIGSQVAAGTVATCPSTSWPCSLNFSVPGTNAAISLQGGHYDNVTLAGFTLPSPPAFGVKTGNSIENLANSLPLTLGTSKSATTGTAVCIDANGRSYEVEFSFL
jgi:type II secretory pathway pseudopilin PulG